MAKLSFPLSSPLLNFLFSFLSFCLVACLHGRVSLHFLPFLPFSTSRPEHPIQFLLSFFRFLFLDHLGWRERKALLSCQARRTGDPTGIIPSQRERGERKKTKKNPRTMGITIRFHFPYFHILTFFFFFFFFF